MSDRDPARFTIELPEEFLAIRPNRPRLNRLLDEWTLLTEPEQALSGTMQAYAAKRFQDAHPRHVELRPATATALRRAAGTDEFRQGFETWTGDPYTDFHMPLLIGMAIAGVVIVGGSVEAISVNDELEARRRLKHARRLTALEHAPSE